MWFYIINFFVAIFATITLRNNIEVLYVSGLLTLIAFLLCILILWLLSALYSRDRFSQFSSIINLTIFFIKELIVANLRVSYEVLTPRNNLKPAVISVPLAIDTELEIMILANMITLTPGTLSIDVAEDHRHLYVHTLYTEGDLETFRRNIKQGFEKKLLATRIK
ncbi:multicomponent Na+:H+ antiporter subunit E [Catalinimonas alkaloidigena]|uniref:Na+/H+ antiporter subunit E n=1 Tax=Catalinimonas alkaloidigena TaxID=1075417 RepID=UPI0024057892|nr:Na+/H+ antiporter subunit E [Catalinimonas alkaloidigena]MDF9795829.1 multicomponent Na+:H+ antiporter subunit E [Catalinimonas alkaloidigena]